MAGNITLSYSTTSNGATSATVSVTMYYYGNGVSWNSDNCKCTITLNGTTKTFYHSFTTSTSAQTMGSADFTITKTHSTQSLSASGSMVTDVSLGTLTASTTVSVSAKTSYSVAYNANSGSGSMSASTKWYNETLTLTSNAFSKSGYTFQGWATSSGGSIAYANKASYTSNSGATLYAQWKKSITLSFDANTGSGAPSSETKSVWNSTTNATFTIPTTVPTKQYYKFTGWKTGSSTYQPGAQISISANTTLTAQWVEDYIPPRYGAVDAYRTDSTGTDNNGTGSYGLLSFTWTNGSLSGTSFNTTASAKYKEHGTSTWTTITNGSSTANTFRAVFGGSLDADKQYDIEITLQDTGYPANTYLTFISAELFTMDVNADGTSIAFMMVAPDTATGVIAPDYNIYVNSEATSGTDYDLIQALTTIGWEDLLGGVTGLIDPSTNESGYIDSSGVEKDDATMTRTVLIPVKYDTYVVKANVPTTGWNVRVNGYDGNGAWVKVLLTFTGTPTYQEKEFSVPDTVSNVRISYHKSGLESVGLFRKI